MGGENDIKITQHPQPIHMSSCECESENTFSSASETKWSPSHDYSCNETKTSKRKQDAAVYRKNQTQIDRAVRLSLLSIVESLQQMAQTIQTQQMDM